MTTDDMMAMQNDAETIEELAATVAHEIKNPIALALANLYMIKTEDKEQQFTYYCGVIEKELYKINSLAIDFISTCSQEGSSLPKPLMERVEINKLIAGVVEDFESAGVTRITFVQGMDAEVLCDAKKLAIVFTNLIKNALEATEEDGAVEISASLSGGRVAIAVKDNGVGFSKAAMSLEHAYTSKSGGSGLGLRICRNTIARHDGTLTIQNNQDKGATVLVSLPLYNLAFNDADY